MTASAYLRSVRAGRPPQPNMQRSEGCRPIQDHVEFITCHWPVDLVFLELVLSLPETRAQDYGNATHAELR